MTLIEIHSDPDELEHVQSRKWTMEEVDACLLLLAVNGGNAYRTKVQLAEQGFRIDPKTLTHWRRVVYPNRYRALALHHGQTIEGVIRSRVRETALRATEATYDAVELEQERIRTGDVKDAGASARNLATTVGIAVTKVLELEGRPTTIVRHETPEETLRGLAELGQVINGSAIDVTPVESQP